MPEGPSIVILKEAVQSFSGQKILRASGNSKNVDYGRLNSATIVAFKSWGKHFLICFKEFTLRIHFLLFGSYSINEEKPERLPRLRLVFSRARSLNFYTCSISMMEEPLDAIYNWSSDVMSELWNENDALLKLKARPNALVCDALLDQQIFSGVGNIIKNEVLFRIRVHPASTVGKIPAAKRKQMVREAVQYSFQFLEWKKQFTLKKHWLVHTKKVCPRDHRPLIKEYMGATHRRTFYCDTCQVLYG